MHLNLQDKSKHITSGHCRRSLPVSQTWQEMPPLWGTLNKQDDIRYFIKERHNNEKIWVYIPRVIQASAQSFLRLSLGFNQYVTAQRCFLKWPQNYLEEKKQTRTNVCTEKRKIASENIRQEYCLLTWALTEQMQWFCQFSPHRLLSTC